MSAFTQRQATPKKGKDYRGIIVRTFESSEDDDSSASDDSNEEQTWKRRKTLMAPSQLNVIPSTDCHPKQDSVAKDSKTIDDSSGRGRRRQRNNVWGSVVEEQRQEQVEREITTFAMDKQMERDVENYSYSDNIALGMMTRGPADEEAFKGRKLIKGVGEDEDDAWLGGSSVEPSDEGARRPKKRDLQARLKHRGSMVADRFRRVHAKSRLGSRIGKEEEVTPMQSVKIDPSGGAKVVAGQLAYSLQEPKGDLMLRIVKVLGVDKALEIWRKTEEIEHDGGMMIRDRSRRRSPGGVFIQLMKTDPDVSKEDIKVIFAEEKKIFEAERKRRKRRTRKFASVSMDVGCRGDSNDEDEPGGGGHPKREGVEDMAMDGKSDIRIKEERDPVNDVKQEGGAFAFIDQKPFKQEGNGFPLPQQDIKEAGGSFLFPEYTVKKEDIPTRKEDSEPEDGEVIDDDDN